MLRYLQGTSKLCLTYDATAGKELLLGYADADWGGCLETRRSTTGHTFSWLGGTVSWKSRRQTTMALSSTQAEVLATTDAAKQAEWLRHLVQGLGFTPDQIQNPTTIYNDNNGAVILSKHSYNHKVNKHFTICTGYLQEKSKDGTIKISKVGTNDNVADILTKQLPQHKVEQHARSLGMHPIPTTTTTG